MSVLDHMLNYHMHHCNIKPCNILIVDKTDLEIVVCDFKKATIEETTHTSPEGVVNDIFDLALTMLQFFNLDDELKKDS